MKIFLLCLFTSLLALPTEVIFMRHGHKAKVPKGTSGEKRNWQKSLTDDGFEDAKSIQTFLQKYKNEHSDGSDNIVLYASPFRRTIMTIACFAKSENIQIRLDRSLGENNSFGHKAKELDDGVWDPKIPSQSSQETEAGCNNPGNKCSFHNNDCTDDNGNAILDIQGTRGPNCDLPIREVVSHCGVSVPEGGLDIIDPNYRQITDESKKWFGKKGKNNWRNDPRVRAEYVYNHIINREENNGKRIIISSHGGFMVSFFNLYVSGGRNPSKWNTGTMNFIRPTAFLTANGKPLQAVGERFSFASTNDMLWTDQADCLSTDQEPHPDFGYLRSPWRLFRGFKRGAKVPMIARNANNKISGLVLELNGRDDEDCNGSRLEYMDCTERMTRTTSNLPVCLLAGWYAPGGFSCLGRSLLMFGSDKTSAKAIQDYREGRLPASKYAGESQGYWLKVTGLETLNGGCQITETAALVSRGFWSEPQVSAFSFESNELHQIALNGEWPEESRVCAYQDGTCVEHTSNDLLLAQCQTFFTISKHKNGCLAYHAGWQRSDDNDCHRCGAVSRDYSSCDLSECNALCADLYSEYSGEVRNCKQGCTKYHELGGCAGRRELISFDNMPFGLEAKSEFKVDGEMSMDFQFSPNPEILMKIVPPFMDIKAEMQFNLQKDISHNINMNRYELTEKKTLYSDFFLVGAVPITVKVLGQALADIHIKGTANVNGLVSMNLDGQIRISDEFVQLRLDLLQGELDFNTIEPTLQLTGFNDIWSFDFNAGAGLDIDVKVGIQLEVVVVDAISFEFTPSVKASTKLSVATPGGASSCPSLEFSASAALGTSMDIGAGLKRQDGNDFNLITLLEDNCKTFEDQLTGGWFDWIDDWHFGLSDLNSGFYYDQADYSAVCSAVFDVLESSISWDGSVKALNNMHYDLNVFDAELFSFDSPQVCMGPETFEVNSRGEYSQGIPETTPRPTPRPTPSPTTTTARPTPRPTPSPTTTTAQPTPRPTPSPTTTTARPTPRPTPSPTDDQLFCATNSDCANDEFCDHWLAFTCQKKRGKNESCFPGANACKSGLQCTAWLLCQKNWWG